MTLRQLDFRNGKYQGYANGNSLNGFGLLLDNDYRFMISYWNNNNLNGPSLIIFDDSTIIYGKIKQNKQ